MRILVVSHSAVVGLYREKFHQLSQLGCEIHLVLPEGWPEGGRWIAAPQVREEKGIRLHVLPGYFLGKVGGFCLRGLHDLALRLQPDVIHAEEEPYSLVCGQVFRIARRLGKPAVFFTWENILRAYKPPLNWIDRWVLKRAGWAIAGNQEAEQVLRQRHFQGQCLVLPQYGIDPERFQPTAQPASEDRFTVGFFGRLLEEKGLATLIKAAQRLTFPFRLEIVGSGPYEQELRRLLPALGDRVRLRSAIPNDEIPQALQALRVLVLPSETRPAWKEQFGRILAEAMACEVPVVGSDSGEIPNVIGPAGLVFPEADDRALAECITRLYQDRSLARRLAQAGRQRVLEQFTTATIARKTFAWYQQISRS
jgi:glycosyltransferase involved in cell wall biosynthesis